MRAVLKTLLAAALALSFALPAGAQTLRLGVQKTGTLAWELGVMQRLGLDKAAGLDLQIVDLATTEAGKLAISGGSVDVVLQDWLWVARERELGHKLKFAPYSSALGAIMVKADGPLASLGDLKGKTLGVAGGPLDKSWLLTQAFAKQSGFDIAHEARVVFGAPPLLAEKAADGELDAALLFWNFASDLETRGFKRLADMGEIEKSLGAKAPVAMVGYVFDEDFAAKNAAALGRFFDASRQAREALANDATLWPAILARAGQKDPAAAALYQKRYGEGAPRRPVADEEADAARLFKTLSALGGEELVGKAATLDAGVYYKPN